MLGLSEESPPELRAYTYSLEGVAVYARVNSRDGLPSDFPALVGESTYSFESVPPLMIRELKPGENVWEVDLPASFWTTVQRTFLASPLARHVVLPKGMQVVEVPVDARELMRLPSIARSISGGVSPRIELANRVGC